MLLSFRPLFSAEGTPINAASILPGLLRDFGDVADVLARDRAAGRSWSPPGSAKGFRSTPSRPGHEQVASPRTRAC